MIMFTWVLNSYLYKFYKSGFLIDFFFKKNIFFIIKYLYVYYTIFFSEKYIIEHVFTNFSKKMLVIWIYFEQLTNQFAYNLIGIIFVVFILYVVLNVKFTQ